MKLNDFTVFAAQDMNNFELFTNVAPYRLYAYNRSD
jgi:hypothetical protein